MKIIYTILVCFLCSLSQNVAIAADFSLSHNEPQTTSHKKEVKKTSKKTLVHKQQIKSKRLARKYADNLKQQHQSHDKSSGAAIFVLALFVLILLVGLGFVIGWLWVLWAFLIVVVVSVLLILVELLFD